MPRSSPRSRAITYRCRWTSETGDGTRPGLGCFVNEERTSRPSRVSSWGRARRLLRQGVDRPGALPDLVSLFMCNQRMEASSGMWDVVVLIRLSLFIQAGASREHSRRRSEPTAPASAIDQDPEDTTQRNPTSDLPSGP